MHAKRWSTKMNCARCGVVSSPSSSRGLKVLRTVRCGEFVKLGRLQDLPVLLPRQRLGVSRHHATVGFRCAGHTDRGVECQWLLRVVSKNGVTVCTIGMGRDAPATLQDPRLAHKGDSTVPCGSFLLVPPRSSGMRGLQTGWRSGSQSSQGVTARQLYSAMHESDNTPDCDGSCSASMHLLCRDAECRRYRATAACDDERVPAPVDFEVLSRPEQHVDAPTAQNSSPERKGDAYGEVKREISSGIVQRRNRQLAKEAPCRIGRDQQPGMAVRRQQSTSHPAGSEQPNHRSDVVTTQSSEAGCRGGGLRSAGRRVVSKGRPSRGGGRELVTPPNQSSRESLRLPDRAARANPDSNRDQSWAIGQESTMLPRSQEQDDLFGVFPEALPDERICVSYAFCLPNERSERSFGASHSTEQQHACACGLQSDSWARATISGVLSIRLKVIRDKMTSLSVARLTQPWVQCCQRRCRLSCMLCASCLPNEPTPPAIARRVVVLYGGGVSPARGETVVPPAAVVSRVWSMRPTGPLAQHSFVSIWLVHIDTVCRAFVGTRKGQRLWVAARHMHELSACRRWHQQPKMARPTSSPTLPPPSHPQAVAALSGTSHPQAVAALSGTSATGQRSLGSQESGGGALDVAALQLLPDCAFTRQQLAELPAGVLAGLNTRTAEVMQSISTHYASLNAVWKQRAFGDAASSLRTHPVPVLSAEQARSLPKVGLSGSKEVGRFVTKYLSSLLQQQETAVSAGAKKRGSSAVSSGGTVPGRKAQMVGEAGERRLLHQAIAGTRLRKLQELDNTEERRVVARLRAVYGIGETTAAGLYARGVRSVADLLSHPQVSLNASQRYFAGRLQYLRARLSHYRLQSIATFCGLVLRAFVHPRAVCVAGGSFRRGQPSCGDVDLVVTVLPGRVGASDSSERLAGQSEGRTHRQRAMDVCRRCRGNGAFNRLRHRVKGSHTRLITGGARFCCVEGATSTAAYLHMKPALQPSSDFATPPHPYQQPAKEQVQQAQRLVDEPGCLLRASPPEPTTDHHPGLPTDRGRERKRTAQHTTPQTAGTGSTSGPTSILRCSGSSTQWRCVGPGDSLAAQVSGLLADGDAAPSLLLAVSDPSLPSGSGPTGLSRARGISACACAIPSDLSWLLDVDDECHTGMCFACVPLADAPSTPSQPARVPLCVHGREPVWRVLSCHRRCTSLRTSKSARPPGVNRAQSPAHQYMSCLARLSGAAVFVEWCRRNSGRLASWMRRRASGELNLTHTQFLVALLSNARTVAVGDEVPEDGRVRRDPSEEGFMTCHLGSPMLTAEWNRKHNHERDVFDGTGVETFMGVCKWPPFSGTGVDLAALSKPLIPADFPPTTQLQCRAGLLRAAPRSTSGAGQAAGRGQEPDSKVSERPLDMAWPDSKVSERPLDMARAEMAAPDSEQARGLKTGRTCASPPPDFNGAGWRSMFAQVPEAFPNRHGLLGTSAKHKKPEDAQSWTQAQHHASPAPDKAPVGLTPLGYHRIDIKFYRFSEMPTALLYFTGNLQLNRNLRLRASRHDMSLSDHVLVPVRFAGFENQRRRTSGFATEKTATAPPLRLRNEADIFQALGLPFLPVFQRSTVPADYIA